MRQSAGRKQSKLLHLILFSHIIINVYASSRGPPPPPPPPPGRYEEDRDYYNRGYTEERRHGDRYDRRHDYEMNNQQDRDRRGYERRYESSRRDPMPSRQREEWKERERSRDIPMDPSRRQKPKRGFNIFSSTDKDDSAFFKSKNDSNEKGKDEEKAASAGSENFENSSYNPIDYKFPSKGLSNESSKNSDAEDDLPRTGREEQPNSESKGERIPEYASARKDAVARYRSTRLGKIKLGIGTFCVGSIVGGFTGKSMMNQGKLFALLFGFLFWFMSFLRNAYGEMARSLGLAFIFLLRRTKYVRRQYRTGAHLRAMSRIGSRRAFPPVMEGEDENPWKYTQQSRNDPEFEMAKSLLCMVIIGSFCGGNINLPLIPTWIGGAGGAACFAIFGVAKNPRGDLIRTMGMRVVALISEAISINSELHVARKVATVGGKIFDKMMILDRKHRIKDRVVQGATWAYERASNAATRVKEDTQESKEKRDRGDDRSRRPSPTTRERDMEN